MSETVSTTVSTTASTGYVTNASWTTPTGRADAIDEIADQFERPAGAEQFWTPEARTEWPRSSRGWRSMGRMHRETGARLVR